MGILFDILDSVLGSNDNQSSNNGFDQQRWDAVVEKINKSLDEGQYSRAESQLGNYYRQYEPEKDYFFYYYRAIICVRWLESYPDLTDEQIQKLSNRTTVSIKRALKLAPDDEEIEKVEEMQAKYETWLNTWKSYKDYQTKWAKFYEEVDNLIDNDNFEQADSLLDDYYKNNSEAFDVPYYERKCFCLVGQYYNISPQDPKTNEILNHLEQVLTEYQPLCDSEEELETFESTKNEFRKLVTINRINLLTENNDFDHALDVVEDYIIDNPQKQFIYCQLKRLVHQRKWRATSVTDNNYAQIEQNVVDAYKEWEESCSSEQELQRVKDCYNDAYVTIKGEKEEEKKNALAKNSMEPTDCDDSESRYREEVLLILEDGEIGNAERKLLERKRIKLGLSEEQAKRIEALCTTILTDDEQEYADIYKDLVEDGEPTGRLRKMLNREAEALGLSPEQVAKVEQMIK